MQNMMFCENEWSFHQTHVRKQRPSIAFARVFGEDTNHGEEII